MIAGILCDLRAADARHQDGQQPAVGRPGGLHLRTAWDQARLACSCAPRVGVSLHWWPHGCATGRRVLQPTASVPTRAAMRKTAARMHRRPWYLQQPFHPSYDSLPALRTPLCLAPAPCCYPGAPPLCLSLRPLLPLCRAPIPRVYPRASPAPPPHLTCVPCITPPAPLPPLFSSSNRPPRPL